MPVNTPVKLILTTAEGERVEVDAVNWSWDMRPGDVLDEVWPESGPLEGSITVSAPARVIDAYRLYERRLLRDLNFGIPGGMSPRRLAAAYGMDVGTVEENIARLLACRDGARGRSRRQFRRASNMSRRARRTRATKEQRSSSRWWGGQ